MIVDLINSALRRTKYPTPIGSPYEGSRASRIALDYFGQTRDWLLDNRDWDFARRNVSLGAPIKTAPPTGYPNGWTSAYPPIPWIYEYAYPVQCISIRSLMPSPVFIPEAMPRYVLFEKANDPDISGPVVLTNLINAQASITARVVDPLQWADSGFQEALIDALAERFAMAFESDANTMLLADRKAQSTAAMANARQG